MLRSAIAFALMSARKVVRERRQLLGRVGGFDQDEAESKRDE